MLCELVVGSRNLMRLRGDFFGKDTPGSAEFFHHEAQNILSFYFCSFSSHLWALAISIISLGTYRLLML